MIPFSSNNNSCCIIENPFRFSETIIESNSSENIPPEEDETLHKLLQHSQFTDDVGAIREPEKLLNLPNLCESQEKLLNLLLDSPLIFLQEKNSVSFPFRKLLEYLYNQHQKDIVSIYIKGGFVRRLLLSKPFLTSMLKNMGFEKEKIISTLNEEFFQSPEGPLPDVDIFFQLRENADPKKLTQTVKECIETGITKFCSIYDSSSNFTIASFGKLEISTLCKYSKNFPKTPSVSETQYTNVEILGVIKSRPYLFPTDAVAIDITHCIKGLKECSFSLKSFYQTGHQTILDLIHRVIRIKNPETINETGFLALLSYHCKSFAVIGDKETLLQTFLKSQQPQKRFINYLKSHYEDNLDYWLAMIFYLSQHRNTALVFESAKEEIDTKKNKLSKPFLTLYKALFTKNISLDSLNAVLSLRALFAKAEDPSIFFKTLEEKQFIQFKLTKEGPTLLIPFMPIESFQLFIDLCKENPLEFIDTAREFFEQILFKVSLENKNRHLMFDGSSKVIQMLKEQISSSNGPLFYFSYLLFLSLCPLDEEKELIFQFLPVAVQEVPDTWRPFLKKYLYSLFPENTDKKLFIQIDDEMLKNPKDFSKYWISLLIKSNDPRLLRLISSIKGFENDLSNKMAISYLESASWTLSKEQEEKILLKVLLKTASFSSKPALKNFFQLVISFLHKVKRSKKKCSDEFKKAFDRLIKIAFINQELHWGTLLSEKAADLGFGPLSKKNQNDLKPLIELSEILFENQKEQHLVDPFLQLLAPKIAENEDQNKKITHWIQKRLQNHITENKLSKLGIRLLSLSRERLAEKEHFDYSLLFYDKACDAQENKIAFTFLKTLAEKQICTFSSSLLLKKTNKLLSDLSIKKTEFCFDFIQTLLPEKVSFAVCFFPAYSSLLSQEQKEKIVTLIFQAIPSWPSTKQLNPIFLLAKDFLEELIESKKTFTEEFKDAYHRLLETAFKENEIKWGKELLMLAIPFNISPTTGKNAKNFSCLLRICEGLFMTKIGRKEVDPFLILLAKEKPNNEEDYKKITDWIQTRLKERIENKKFSDSDIKFLKLAENRLTEEEIYDHTLQLYEKAHTEGQDLTATTLLRKLLQSRFCKLNNQILIKTTNTLFNDLLSKNQRTQKITKNQEPVFLDIDIGSLVEFLFQQKEVHELSVFSIFSKHALLILKFVKESLNLNTQIKMKVVEKILEDHPNENPQTELELLEQIWSVRKEKNETFYKRVKELSLLLMSNGAQAELFERAFYLLNNPTKSEEDFWDDAFVAILSNIKTLKQLEICSDVFHQTVVKNLFLSNTPRLFINCWHKILELHQSFHYFPQIMLETASQELQLPTLTTHDLDSKLEIFLLESNVSEYFEQVLSSVERKQQKKKIPSNLLMILSKGRKRTECFERLENIFKIAISDKQFLSKIDLLKLVKTVINYKHIPLSEQIRDLLVNRIEQFKNQNPSPNVLHSVGRSTKLFLESLSLPKENFFAMALLLNPLIYKFLSRKDYTKFCAEFLIEYFSIVFVEKASLDENYICLRSLYMQIDYDPKTYHSWVEAITYVLVTPATKDLKSWNTFENNEQEICNMIANTSLEELNNQKNLSKNPTLIFVPKSKNRFIDLKLIDFKNTLLNKLLDCDHDFIPTELVRKIEDYFSQNLIINVNLPTKEKNEITLLLEKFLFWKPYSSKKSPHCNQKSHQDISQHFNKLYEAGYFDFNVGCKATFYFRAELQIPSLKNYDEFQKSELSLLNYIKKTTFDNDGESICHCIRVLEENTNLLKSPKISTSIYRLFIEKCFSLPLIIHNFQPLCVSLMKHLILRGIKGLIEQQNNPEELLPLASYMIECGLFCLGQSYVSKEDLEGTAYLSAHLFGMISKFLDVFVNQQEAYHDYLDQCMELLPSALEILNNIDGHIIADYNCLEIVNASLLQRFRNEEEHSKSRREERYESFLRLLKTVCNGKFQTKTFSINKSL